MTDFDPNTNNLPHPSQRPECTSADYPDPLVNDCEDLLRPEVREEITKKSLGTSDPSDSPWTTIETPPVSESAASTEETKTEDSAEHDDDWAEKSLDEVKAGLKQISNALKFAFNEGKNDPKIKQFGEDVKSAFDKIGDDIAGIFKKE